MGLMMYCNKLLKRALSFFIEHLSEELRLYEGYCRARQQFGYPVELPQFNDYGSL